MEIPDMCDFQIADQGSIFLIRPLNEPARQWLDENVVSERQWVQGALCVEARFARDLVIESNRPASWSPADRPPQSRCIAHAPGLRRRSTPAAI
jgi:hypothetical protein